MWEETVLSDASMSGIRQLCWKPGSRDTITVATRNGVFVWSTIGDLESQSLFQVSAEANVLSAQYSPNGEYSPHVAVMCRYLCVIRKDDYRVYLYNTCDYQLVNTLGSLTCLPRKVLFSPDCQLLVVLSECGCGGVAIVGETCPFTTQSPGEGRTGACRKSSASQIAAFRPLRTISMSPASRRRPLSSIFCSSATTTTFSVSLMCVCDP